MRCAVAPEVVLIVAFVIVSCECPLCFMLFWTPSHCLYVWQYTVVQGEALTAATAFTTIALFNLLRFPMAMLPRVVVSVIEVNRTLYRSQHTGH